VLRTEVLGISKLRTVVRFILRKKTIFLVK